MNKFLTYVDTSDTLNLSFSLIYTSKVVHDKNFLKYVNKVYM